MYLSGRPVEFGWIIPSCRQTLVLLRTRTRATSWTPKQPNTEFFCQCSARITHAPSFNPAPAAMKAPEGAKIRARGRRRYEQQQPTRRCSRESQPFLLKAPPQVNNDRRYASFKAEPSRRICRLFGSRRFPRAPIVRSPYTVRATSDGLVVNPMSAI